MPGTIGDSTNTLFLTGPESHKLHLAFEVADDATIKKGQLVILTSAGKVSPALTASPEGAVIGVSLHDGTEGEIVTVATRGYAVIYGEASAALDPGPVQNTTNAGTVYPARFAQAAAISGFIAATSAGDATTAITLNNPKQIGWALDAATADEDVIRVLLKD